MNGGFFYRPCVDRGAFSPHTVVERGIFHHTALKEPLAHQTRTRPAAKRRAGFVFGEGGSSSAVWWKSG